MIMRIASYSAALLCVSACGVTEPTIDRLHVTVALSEPEIAPGDTTHITVRATNPTDSDLEFSSNSCVLVLQIVDSTDQEVYPGTVPCLDILIIHRLAPGEYLEERFTFDGWGRRVLEEAPELYPLAPGTYWVRGSVTSRRENPSEPVQLQVIAGVG